HSIGGTIESARRKFVPGRNPLQRSRRRGGCPIDFRIATDSIRGAELRAAVSIFFQFVDFIRNEKKWWLIPVVGILVVLSLLVIALQNPWLAPFIYPLF